MSQADAAVLLGVFTSVLLPYAHSWMKSNILPDWVKFVVAVIISAFGGFLTVYSSGELVTSLSVIQMASVLGAAGAGIYVAVFGKLGLEKVIMPRAAVITEAQKSVAAQIGYMSKQTIREAVDPESNTVISVRAEAAEYLGPEPDPVQPRG